MLPKNRRPTPPGEILRFEFMESLGLTQKQLAEALGITRVRVNEIINGKRAITADTAFRLSRYFGTTAELWLNLQRSVDLWDTLQIHGQEYERIEPVGKASNG
jgi:addiction module HigA family antidote